MGSARDVPCPVTAARLVEPPVRLHVDDVAGTERDELHVAPEPVDDPETSYPIAAQTLELALQRLAGVWLVENRLKRGSNLALEHGMKATDERRDLVRNSQPARQAPVVIHRSYSNSSSSV